MVNYQTSRRSMLQAASVAIGLPLFESMATPTVASAKPSNPANFHPDAKPRRMVCICNSLGLHLPNFIPEGTGKDYKPSPYLQPFDELRDQLTVVTGVSHPEVDGGHSAERSFLTTAVHPGSSSFKNRISLDQFAADFIGRQTRFSSLPLTASGNNTLSWTRAGVPIPSATRPSQVFAKLFLNGSEASVEEQILELRVGRSIMDHVGDQAKQLHKKLSRTDRQKFDEYVTSVRELEQEMLRQQAWEKTPKPKVNVKPPQDIDGEADCIGRTKLMFDLSRLALQTDSTRLITIMMQGFFVAPPIEGVEEGYHTLSHHGQDPRKLEQLALIEIEHMKIFAKFLRELHHISEQEETLLDRTMVLYGSNLGNASAHNNINLPTMLAGGGFKHGQHLAFDSTNNEPLGNLFVSMLQRLGIDTNEFGSGKRPLPGLAMT
jgi:hypothetical protein